MRGALAERRAGRPRRRTRRLAVIAAAAAALLAAAVHAAGSGRRGLAGGRCAARTRRRPRGAHIIARPGTIAGDLRARPVDRESRRVEAAARSLRGRRLVAARPVRGGHTRSRGDRARARWPAAVVDRPAWRVSQDARWSPDGFRIAYRNGRALRIVAGDGTGDRRRGPRGAGRTRVVAACAAPGRVRRRARPHRRGGRRHVQGATGARRPAMSRPSSRGRRTAPACSRSVRIGCGCSARAAGFSVADTPARTVGRRRPHSGRPRTSVRPRDLTTRRGIGAAWSSSRPTTPARARACWPGPGGSATWSGPRTATGCWPAGPRADQWVFIRAGRAPGAPIERLRAVGNISRQFDPGGSGPAEFPGLSEWCCAAVGLPK